MSNQQEIADKMRELTLDIVNMSDDEFDIFVQNNKLLIETIIEALEG